MFVVVFRPLVRTRLSMIVKSLHETGRTCELCATHPLALLNREKKRASRPFFFIKKLHKRFRSLFGCCVCGYRTGRKGQALLLIIFRQSTADSSSSSSSSSSSNNNNNNTNKILTSEGRANYHNQLQTTPVSGISFIVFSCCKREAPSSSSIL